MKTGTKYSETLRYGRVWLGKRADSGIWYMRYVVPKTGKAFLRSTGTTQKKQALREADIMSGQLQNQKYNIADGNIPVSTLMEKFIAAKDGRIKVKSIERLKTSIASFKMWLASTHPEVALAKHLSSELIREFQSYRAKQALSLRSVNNDITNLHSVFLWAVRENLMVSSPANYAKTGTVDLYELPTCEPDIYSQDEVQALLAAAKASGDILTHDLITAYARSGCRFEELTHLTRSFVHWDTPIPEIEIRAHDGWSPKDPKEIKRIPMVPELQAIIRRRCQQCQSDHDFIFKNSIGGKVHNHRARKRLYKLFPAAGIDGNRRLCWHSFRNYFVVDCLKRNVAVNVIMDWTGHDSASMVLHYAKAMNKSDIYAEAKKLFLTGTDAGESTAVGKDLGKVV